ncbi:hypothetical protein V2J09_007576 [Rumex salicifolius]
MICYTLLVIVFITDWTAVREDTREVLEEIDEWRSGFINSSLFFLRMGMQLVSFALKKQACTKEPPIRVKQVCSLIACFCLTTNLKDPWQLYQTSQVIHESFLTRRGLKCGKTDGLAEVSLLIASCQKETKIMYKAWIRYHTTMNCSSFLVLVVPSTVILLLKDYFFCLDGHNTVHLQDKNYALIITDLFHWRSVYLFGMDLKCKLKKGPPSP